MDQAVEHLSESPYFKRLFKGKTANFGRLQSANELKALDDYLSERSYISGYRLSCDDRLVLNQLNLSGHAPASNLNHIHRWKNHVESVLGDDCDSTQPPYDYSSLCQKLFGVGSSSQARVIACFGFSPKLLI